jgi:hypothetical protein
MKKTKFFLIPLLLILSSCEIKFGLANASYSYIVSSDSSSSQLTGDDSFSAQGNDNSSSYEGDNGTTSDSSSTSSSSSSENSSSSDSSSSSSDSSSSSSEEITTDPYVGISSTSFYSSYKEATSYKDACYRSQHYFMSGDLSDQDFLPTLAATQPKQGNQYYRNTDSFFSEDGKAYSVVDYKGDISFTVYYGGGYVTLEEVAAYVYAFSDVPANYYASTSNTKLSSFKWGNYTRLNNNYFSDDTSSYLYEPSLPDAYGDLASGNKQYYEIDIGTTGNTEDYSYNALPYINGTKIKRGTSRIVYTKCDKNGNSITDMSQRYVFYTYDHYNDFQEYLNYEGGWGQRFGNLTGGGEYNNNDSSYKTSYPETLSKAF